MSIKFERFIVLPDSRFKFTGNISAWLFGGVDWGAGGGGGAEGSLLFVCC